MSEAAAGKSEAGKSEPTVRTVEWILAELAKDPPPEVVRDKGGYKYVDTYYVISEANRIFGVAGWMPEILTDPHVVAEFTRQAEKDQTFEGKKQKISVINRVACFESAVRAHVPVLGPGVYRDGIGSSVAESEDGGSAWAGQIETASKGSYTDGLKRALVQLGPRFGLNFYRDKPKQSGGGSRPKPQDPKEAAAAIVAAAPQKPEEKLPYFKAKLLATRSKEQFGAITSQVGTDEALRKALNADAEIKAHYKAIPDKLAERGDWAAVSFPFGNDKGLPISEMSDSSLTFYENACKRDIADPAKQQYARKSQERLDAIAAERKFRAEHPEAVAA